MYTSSQLHRKQCNKIATTIRMSSEFTGETQPTLGNLPNATYGSFSRYGHTTHNSPNGSLDSQQTKRVRNKVHSKLIY